jgi:hypothetical protein
MKKILVFILFSITALVTFGQKRNNIKLFGFGYDTWTSDENYLGLYYTDEFVNSSSRFSYILGYERLIGSRLSVSGTYNYIFGSDQYEFNEESSFQTEYTPEKIPNPNQLFYRGFYTTSGYTLGYETKYFFNEFDEDGANSLFIGFNYQYTKFKEELSDVQYEYVIKPNPLSNDFTSPQDYAARDYSINRFGVKLGATYTGVLSSEFAIGMYLNMPAGFDDAAWRTPVPINPLSFNLTWVLGVPF